MDMIINNIYTDFLIKACEKSYEPREKFTHIDLIAGHTHGYRANKGGNESLGHKLHYHARSYYT